MTPSVASLPTETNSTHSFQTMLKRIGAVFFGGLLSRFLLFGFELSFAASDGTAAFGRWAIAFGTLQMSASLALMGLDFGAIKFLAAFRESGRTAEMHSLVRMVLCRTIVAGVVAGGILSCVASLLSEYAYHKPELSTLLFWTGFLVPLQATALAIAAVFRGIRKPFEGVLISATIPTFSVALLLPFLWSIDVDPLLVLRMHAVGALVACIYGIARLSQLGFILRSCSQSSPSVLRDVRSYSRPMFIWSLLNMGSLPILLAGALLPPSEVGVFCLMLRMFVLFSFPQSVVNACVPVEFAKLSHRRDTPELTTLFKGVSTGLMLLSCGLAIPLALDIRQVFAWIGHDLGTVSVYFLPLLAAQVVNVGTGPVGQLLIYAGGHTVLIRLSLFSVALQATLYALLVPLFGLIGAISAQSISILIFTSVRHLLSFRITGIHGFHATTLMVYLLTVLVICLAQLLPHKDTGAFGYVCKLLAIYAGCFLPGILLIHRWLSNNGMSQLTSGIGSHRKRSRPTHSS